MAMLEPPLHRPRLAPGLLARRARGFTLLEILVALAVVAIALTAAVQAAARISADGAYLRDQTLAHWVAMNKLAELQLDAVWPAPGQQRGVYSLGARDWYVTLRVSATPDADVRRVDIGVRADPQAPDPLVELVSFVGRTS
jgi:general secretion pathway protein I